MAAQAMEEEKKEGGKRAAEPVMMLAEEELEAFEAEMEAAEMEAAFEAAAEIEAAYEAAEDTAELLLAMRVDNALGDGMWMGGRAGFPVMSTVDEVMDTLKSMTLLEASELVKQIEETFDVDASVGGGMMMAAPMAGGAVAGGD